MDEKKQFGKKFVLPVLGVMLLVCLSVGLLFYWETLQKGLQLSRCDTLNNVMEQQRFTFISKLMDQKNAMEVYSDFIAYTDLTNEDELLLRLNLVANQSTFENLSIAFPNGDTLENTGTHLNIADRDYFKRALKGETVVDGPFESKVRDENIVTFSTPVLKDGQQIAVLIGVYNSCRLSELLMPTFSGNGYAYVTTSDGRIIFRTQTSSAMEISDNLYDILDTADFSRGENIETLKQDIAENEAGYISYFGEDKKRLMCYTPIGINDWYIFSAAPEKFINPKSFEITYCTTGFILVVAVLTILSFLYVYREQQKHMKELRRIAFVDSLTGGFNKKQFKVTGSALLADMSFHYAFAILDIDKFKVLNDTLGYQCGDTLLRTISQILSERMQEREIFCRYDSDEFYMLISYKDDANIRARVQTIFDHIESEFAKMQDYNYNLVLCCGIYVITGTGESINTISDRARHAHSLIKGRDESGIAFYNEEIRKGILQEKFIENRMHDALRNEEFLIYLQPKYYLEDDSIYGAEALVRWDCSDGIMIYPNDFIPVFEKNGFITKLDMYMLEKACQTIRGWLDAGIRPIPISINFSRLHLRTPSFVDDIAEIVQKYSVPEYLIEIELTESTMLHNEDVLINMLEQLHNYGFTLSMDDFGSGYSSLGLLKNLPVDVIKLDRTFFVDYCELKRAVLVVAGILNMAKNLGIKTVAEGVETKEQVEFLRALGCDIVQGYYYAKPMTTQALTSILEQGGNGSDKNTNACLGAI